MKPKFKTGDVLVVVNNPKMVHTVKKVLAHEYCVYNHIRNIQVNLDWKFIELHMELKEIYESPLYQALREE